MIEEVFYTAKIGSTTSEMFYKYSRKSCSSLAVMSDEIVLFSSTEMAEFIVCWSGLSHNRYYSSLKKCMICI